jgi:hypothetical protein
MFFLLETINDNNWMENTNGILKKGKFYWLLNINLVNSKNFNDGKALRINHRSVKLIG